MGNRGCLHDADQVIRRQYRGRAWIICLLEFKGRRRSIMAPGQYTELFFLDEATALAAGHRPCAECQRQRFNHFRDLWASANPDKAGSARPSAPTLDAALHVERMAASDRADSLCTSLADLPDGVFITDNEQDAYLVVNSQLWRWSPAGYEPAGQHIQFPARVLTPPSVVRTLAVGYPVGIHESAGQPNSS